MALAFSVPQGFIQNKGELECWRLRFRLAALQQAGDDAWTRAAVWKNTYICLILIYWNFKCLCLARVTPC